MFWLVLVFNEYEIFFALAAQCLAWVKFLPPIGRYKQRRPASTKLQAWNKYHPLAYPDFSPLICKPKMRDYESN